MTKLALVTFAAVLAASPVLADAPNIVDVEVQKAGAVWRFEVTVVHPDTGWDHYADGWEILDAAGHRIGWRELRHPHVTEQPFTRSLGNIMLPDGTTEVFIRAHCTTDGWSTTATRVGIAY
jgi:hypothetical protein